MEDLIVKVAKLSMENDQLKNEVQILTNALRDLQWRYDRLVESMMEMKKDE